MLGTNGPPISGFVLKYADGKETGAFKVINGITGKASLVSSFKSDNREDF